MRLARCNLQLATTGNGARAAACGTGNGHEHPESYPYCRPCKRVDEHTPRTVGEMGTDLNIDDVQAMIDEHDIDKTGEAWANYRRRIFAR